jgi:hypothetical protein
MFYSPHQPDALDLNTSNVEHMIEDCLKFEAQRDRLKALDPFKSTDSIQQAHEDLRRRMMGAGLEKAFGHLGLALGC